MPTKITFAQETFEHHAPNKFPIGQKFEKVTAQRLQSSFIIGKNAGPQKAMVETDDKRLELIGMHQIPERISAVLAAAEGHDTVVGIFTPILLYKQI